MPKYEDEELLKIMMTLKQKKAERKRAKELQP